MPMFDCQRCGYAHHTDDFCESLLRTYEQPRPLVDRATEEKIMTDSLALFQVISSLKLPKKTRLIGTKAGTEVHRPDGVSYLVSVIPPRATEAAS